MGRIVKIEELTDKGTELADDRLALVTGGATKPGDPGGDRSTDIVDGCVDPVPGGGL